MNNDIKDINKSFWVNSMDLDIDPAGKHIIDFDKDLPIIVKPVHFYVDYPLTPNYHDYLEITYVLNGNGICIVNNRKYPVRKGDIFIINNVDLHTFLANPNEKMSFVSIIFLPEVIYRPGDNGNNLNFLNIFYCQNENFSPRIQSSDVPEETLDLIFKIYLELENKKTYYALSSKTYLQELLLILLFHYSNNLDTSRQAYNRNLSDIERLRDVFVLVANNYNKNISLEEASKSACMCSQYFCKFFKKVTGVTFKEYLLNIRIDKAKELLLKDNTMITTIAFKVGFDNLSYFYRVFKKFTHLNPKDFRTFTRNM